MSVVIRGECASDRMGIRQVNSAAFGSTDEADLVDRLREGGFVVASLVAVKAEHVVGHILFSRLTISTQTGRVEAAALAPMAVLPNWQRQGLGSQMVRAGLEACRQHGQQIVTVLGHPDYYPRFGFSAQLAEALVSPFGGGDAWMAIELVSGALAGVAGQVEYSSPFRSFE